MSIKGVKCINPLLITLPWPSPTLSPNRARNVHWSQKAKAVKAARLQARMETMAVLAPEQRGRWPCEGELPMTVTFCPPDRRRRDRDGMIGASKALQDGISDALGIDDSRFVPTYRVGDVVKGGRVVVEIDRLRRQLEVHQAANPALLGALERAGADPVGFGDAR